MMCKVCQCIVKLVGEITKEKNIFLTNDSMFNIISIMNIEKIIMVKGYPNPLEI